MSTTGERLSMYIDRMQLSTEGEDIPGNFLTSTYFYWWLITVHITWKNI